LFAFIVTPKRKIVLALKNKQKLSPNVTGFEFTSTNKLPYLPGQYLETTLPQSKTDGRGNRRTFTIASSPTEDTLQLGIKFYEPGSTFKKALSKLTVGQKIVVGNVGGEFILPKDKSVPLVFIAGGIGITPFRSMVKYLIDTNQKRSIELLYFVNSKADAVYKDVFEEAKRVGVTTHIETKAIDENSLKKYMATSTRQLFYISGPPAMVRSYKKSLKKIGVRNRAIKTDCFTGY